MDLFAFAASLAGLGLIFWIVAFIALASLLAAKEGEHYKISAGITVGAFLVLLYLGGSTIKQAFFWVVNNPTTLVEYIFAYAVLGIVWSLVKWVFHLWRIRDRLIDYRQKENIKSGVSLNEDQRKAFFFYARDIMGKTADSLPPRARENKARITSWMIYWPISMPWTLVNEPVKRFFTFAYYRLAGILEGISTRMFRGLA